MKINCFLCHPTLNGGAAAHLGGSVQPLPRHGPLALGSSSSFLQQGRDDVVGDVEELLVDLLVLAEIVIAAGGEKR